MFKKDDLDQDNAAILKFFSQRSQSEIERLTTELSPEARDFFEGNIQGMIGCLPDEMIDSTLTMKRATLAQLLFSSMITGYATKSVEDKIKLEALWAPETENNLLMDTTVTRNFGAKEDIDNFI